MGTYLHRITKSYFKSIPPNELPEAVENYIDTPDLSAVEGVPSKYWVITGDVVSEMSQEEKNTVDFMTLNDQREAAVNEMIDGLESDLRQLVRLIMSELNILRAEHGLAPRTLAQLKTAIRNGYGN